MNDINKRYKATLLQQEITDDHATLLLQITPDIAYFEGHFNDFPLLAGVVQLDWAIYYAKQVLNVEGAFSGMEVIKFQQPILPNTNVLLTLRWEEDKQKLYFSYTSKNASDNSIENNHASGRIKLERLS